MWKPEQFAWLGEDRYNRYSQFGEDSIIEKIFARIGAANKWCCECGAADGIFFSNSRKLIEEGWSAVLIEADEQQYTKLRELYYRKDAQGLVHQDYPVTCYRRRVTPSNQGEALTATFDQILSEQSAPLDLDLLVIDVDGQDYWLFNSLVKYHPRVVMVEYDPAADKDFIPPMGGAGQAGLNAIINLGIGKYYWPVAITSTNVIFVQQELCGMLVGAERATLADVKPTHLHESESGVTACVHCGLSGVWPLVGKSIASKAALPAEKPPHVALVMSTGRLGFLGTMDCVIQSVHSLPISWLRGEGVFWSQTLSRGISRAIKAGADYIITADHDTVFEHAHTDNAIAKLVCLMHDNPDVDVIIAAQMKREGGPLLATSDQEIRLLDPLVRVTRGHFGLTIFRPSVFERLPKPWFYEKPNEDGDWEENRIDADIGFWKNCEESGINVRMSLDVLIGHIELVVTWPGQNLETVYQSMQDWRDNGKPPEAFDRQRVIAAVKANPALLYGPKLEMGG